MIEEMNRTILERLNSLAKANDILYSLGTSASIPKQEQGRYDAGFDARRYSLCLATTDNDTQKLTREFSWPGNLAGVSING